MISLWLLIKVKQKTKQNKTFLLCVSFLTMIIIISENTFSYRGGRVLENGPPYPFLPTSQHYYLYFNFYIDTLIIFIAFQLCSVSTLVSCASSFLPNWGGKENGGREYSWTRSLQRCLEKLRQVTCPLNLFKGKVLSISAVCVCFKMSPKVHDQTLPPFYVHLNINVPPWRNSTEN